MTKFTNIKNILLVCVDILVKLSYNVERVLLKCKNILVSLPKIILFVFLFLLAMLMSAFPAESSDLPLENDAGGAVRLSLLAEFGEENGILLTVTADGAELCGLLFSLRYMPERFEFVGISSKDAISDGATVSYSVEDGEIKLLIDADKNIVGGEIVLLEFRYKNEISFCEDAVFELYPRGRGVLRSENGDLVEINLLGCSTVFSANDDKLVYDTFSVGLSRLSDGSFALNLSVQSDGVFSGAEAIVTELYGGESERYLVAGMSPDGSKVCFDKGIFVRQNRKYTVLLRSVRWSRGGAEYGEERLYLIFDGAVRCVG